MTLVMTNAAITIVCSGMALVIRLFISVIVLTALSSFHQELVKYFCSDFSNQKNTHLSKLIAQASGFGFFILQLIHPFTLRRAGAAPGKGFADKSEQTGSPASRDRPAPPQRVCVPSRWSEEARPLIVVLLLDDRIRRRLAGSAIRRRFDMLRRLDPQTRSIASGDHAPARLRRLGVGCDLRPLVSAEQPMHQGRLRRSRRT